MNLIFHDSIWCALKAVQHDSLLKQLLNQTRYSLAAWKEEFSALKDTCVIWKNRIFKTKRIFTVIDFFIWIQSDLGKLDWFPVMTAWEFRQKWWRYSKPGKFDEHFSKSPRENWQVNWDVNPWSFRTVIEIEPPSQQLTML